MKSGYKEVPMTEEEEREQRRLSTARSARAGCRWGRALGFGAVNVVACLGTLAVSAGVGLLRGGVAVAKEGWDASEEARHDLADNIKERLDRIADLAEEGRPAPAKPRRRATTVRLHSDVRAAPAAEPAPQARPTVRARRTENGRSQVIEGELLDPVTQRP